VDVDDPVVEEDEVVSTASGATDTPLHPLITLVLAANTFPSPQL
jgi:hypothetical protein